MNLNKYTMFAVDAAKKAGELLQEYAQKTLRITNKEAHDFVTDADLASQKLIGDLIERHFPGHKLIGEEDLLTNEEVMAKIHAEPETFWWIANPLDGTLNYIKHLSSYCVSLALVKGRDILSGAIYVPPDDEMFCAQKDGGAWLGDKKLRVSPCSTVRDALVTTGIQPTDEAARLEAANMLHRAVQRTMNVRMLGSAAREMAFIAAGRLDAYWERGPHPWDVAAGILMIQEAGGKVTAMDLSEYQLGSPAFLVTNGLIHEAVYESVIREP